MRNGSLYLPQVDLWCDARHPTSRSFISHAHSDHLAEHQSIITSEGTARLMAARLPRQGEELILPFDTPYALDAKTELRLHPAGHILGSAMLQLTRAGESFLYTGDFKMRRGLSAESCQPPSADVVVMETTFGLPRYVFPPTEKTLANIVHFCRATVEDGEIPVLFGYSLGKSQELLACLATAGLPVMLHPQPLKLTRIYEELGQVFPPYRAFAPTEAAGHVVICPPQANQSSWLRKIKPRRTAAITGWAMDPGAVYRYQCDAAFPLSDHADYHELLDFIDVVRPNACFYRARLCRGIRPHSARARHRGVGPWSIKSTRDFPGANQPRTVTKPVGTRLQSRPAISAAKREPTSRGQ